MAKKEQKLEDVRISEHLSFACFGGDIKEIGKLLKQIPVDTPNHHGRTALYWTVALSRTKHLEVVELLLEAGADPAAPQEGHPTPLTLAIVLSSPQDMKFLLVPFMLRKTDPDDPRHIWDNKTPLMWAVEKCSEERSFGNEATLDFLLKAGADPWLKNAKGQTAFDFDKSGLLDKYKNFWTENAEFVCPFEKVAKKLAAPAPKEEKLTPASRKTTRPVPK